MAEKTKMELFLELTKAIRDSQSANQKLDAAVFKSLGINQTDGRCLDVIDHHGPLPAGELATAAGLTTGAVTQVIDRLEAKGFVERTPDPEDRRRVLVGVTEKGRSRAHAHYSPLAEKAQRELLFMTRADLELLIDFHHRTTALQDERADEILESL